jgi:hypothetical protein
MGGVPDFVVMGARFTAVVANKAGAGIAIPGKAGVVSHRTLLVRTATTLVYTVTADLESPRVDELITVIAVDEPAITTFNGIPISVLIGAVGAGTTLRRFYSTFATGVEDPDGRVVVVAVPVTFISIPVVVYWLCRLY